MPPARFTELPGVGASLNLFALPSGQIKKDANSCSSLFRITPLNRNRIKNLITLALLNLKETNQQYNDG